MSNEDRTEYQTERGQSTSKKLSMQATTPPGDVPGYRLERFLGSGAFGQVWVGRDLNTGRPVAVKFFLHRGGVNWSLLSHEVKNLVQLSADRHVVQVLEVGWDSDPPFYVMELVTGGSLEEMLSERGALPVAEAVEMFRRICTGLNHSHSKGVLHCDLKPANILLGEDHEPRLADFGQSRMTHDQTPALGTLFYMAPEQADLGSTPSSGWDVYAAGAIMYRMLTGSPPYRDETIVEQLDTAGSLPKRLQRYRESIQKAPPPTQHTTRRGVDRVLSRIVSRCLAADPNERYTNVQEILQHLEEREETRARRPLMLLGILGPMLLLIATAIFAERTIDQASVSTEEALRKEAFAANQLAAKFAARTLEAELERYFRLCLDETGQAPFVAKLGEALRDPDLKQQLKVISDQGTSERAGEMTEVRERVFDNAARQELDQYLAGALGRYTSAPVDARAPRLASIFVTDSAGTIFSIAYDREVSRDLNSTGRNYAYRTYYHAGKNDLPRDTPIESIEPLSRMHLSAAFQSTATGLWKVAVSLPVYLTEGPEREKPDAVFVITINLGDIELLQGDAGANLVAVLIEAREGPMRGTVLQHPYLESRHAQGRPYKKSSKVDGETLQELLSGGDVDYVDPLASADDAEVYSGNWIAAMQPVEVPSLSLESDASVSSGAHNGVHQADLMVLVQYRLAKVFAPVGSMRSSLRWEGGVAIISLFLVSATLYLFVRRAGVDHTLGGSRVRGLKSTAATTAAIPTPSASVAASSRDSAKQGLTETMNAPLSED